jgi:hypothetical protein
LPHLNLAAVRMQDDLNIEIAGTLSEGRGKDAQPRPPKTGWEEVVEILEAFLLAFVAIATAWSGFQAARWDGRETELYAQASTIRVGADQILTLGGQQRLLDVTTFNTWIEARFEGRTELMELYERRFSPEYKVAFDAWLATDPFSNPEAPPGPSFMPEYVNPQLERGAEMNELANRRFVEGTAARGHADDYIRTTVMLATVLFLIALSQRFRVRRVRYGVLAVAGGLMIFGLATILTYPRL